MELFRDIHTQIKTPYGYTNPIKLNSGVRQGDVIFPTLFIISLAPLIWKISQLSLKQLPNGSRDHILTYVDDTSLIASCTEDIIKIFDITAQYAKDFGIHINAKKSGYAWLNSTQPAIDLQYNKQAIPILGSEKCYKYLGLLVNLELDWSQMLNSLKENYQQITQLILRKHYLPTNLKIKLINSIAPGLIQYRMQMILLPQH